MAARAGTETDVGNLALSHCESTEIVSLDDGNARARAVKRHFGTVRDALLRRRDWNFATEWYQPAALTDDALGPLKKRYNLPPDCLKVRFVKDIGNDAWAVESADTGVRNTITEGIILVSNAAPLPPVCGTRVVQSPVLWDALFVEVFALKLGAAIAPRVARNKALAVSLDAKAEDMLAEASRIDARETARSEVTRTTSWLAARR